MKKPTTNDLLDALREHGRALPKRPPGDGWYTLDELAQLGDTTPPALKYRIAMARKRGVKVEMAPGTALDAEGFCRKSIYYRLGGKP